MRTVTDTDLEELANRLSWVVEKTNYANSKDCERRVANSKRILAAINAWVTEREPDDEN